MKYFGLFLTFLLISVSYVQADEEWPGIDIGIVIEVAVNNSVLHMYKWDRRQTNRSSVNIRPFLEPVYTLRNTTTDAFAKGLHYAAIDTVVIDGVTRRVVDTPELDPYVSNKLAQLISYAKLNIPESRWESVYIWFKGTGGMQSLSIADQGLIWAAVRRYIRNSTPFVFQDSWFSTITPQEQGIFNFVAVNLLEKRLERLNVTNWGAISLQGDNLYVTFEPSTPARMHNFTIDYKFPNYIDDVTKVYSVVYPGYGVQSQWDRYNQLLISQRSGATDQYSPCLFAGANYAYSYGGMNYNFIGTGDWNMCYGLVGTLVNKTVTCSPQNQPCLFNGVYSPPLPSSYAFDDLFNVVTQLVGDLVLTNHTMDIVKNISTEVCRYQWSYVSTAKTLAALSDAERMKLCFGPIYVYRLFNDGFEIPRYYNDQLAANRVIRVRQFAGVNNTKIAWTLGAVNYEVSRLTVAPSSAAALSISFVTLAISTLVFLFV